MTDDKNYEKLDDIANTLHRIYKDYSPSNSLGKKIADDLIFAIKGLTYTPKERSESFSHSQWRSSNGAPDEKKEETVESVINTDEEAVRLLKKIESFMDDDEDFRDGEEYLWLVDRYTQLGNKDIRVKDTDK